MATINLNRDEIGVDSSLDCIVIIKALADIPGGRALDVTGFTPTVIKAGHIIICSNEGVFKPMPVNSGNSGYKTLPESHKIVGVLKASIPTTDARAAIVTMGQINAAASPYPISQEIKTALPNIQFLYEK